MTDPSEIWQKSILIDVHIAQSADEWRYGSRHLIQNLPIEYEDLSGQCSDYDKKVPKRETDPEKIVQTVYLHLVQKIGICNMFQRLRPNENMRRSIVHTCEAEVRMKEEPCPHAIL